MHAILKIEEIIFTIFRLLERGDAARCAQVCRTWFPPAIKIIWESVDINRLVKSVYDHTGQLEKADDAEQSVLHQNLTRTKWSRFRLYSSHVRGLDLAYVTSLADDYSCDPEFPSVLPLDGLFELQDISKGPLFPRVRQLRCRIALHSHLSISRILRHLPRLASFDISFDSQIELKNMDYFWTSFRMICPNLVTLKMTIQQRPCDMGKFWNSFGDALRLCDKLEALVCGSQDTTMDISVFHAIALLPNLKKIEGTFGSTPYVRGDTKLFEYTPDMYPRLDELVLHNAHTITCAQGSWLSSNALRAFSCTDPLMYDAYHNAICWLSSKQPLIERLSLCLWSSIHQIQDMGEFHSLQHLSISVLVGGVMISDDDIALVAAELPELRVVELFSCSATDPPSLTLQAINHLVTFCPSLHTIMLDFDATLVPATCVTRSASDSPPQTRHQYSSLLLLIPPTDPPIADPKAVANWLSYHCGRYSDVIIDRDGELELGEHWAAVRRLVNRALYARRAGMYNTLNPCN